MLMLLTQSVVAKNITQCMALFDKQKQSQEALFPGTSINTVLKRRLCCGFPGTPAVWLRRGGYFPESGQSRGIFCPGV
jgi:hypothetical protein